MMKCHNCGKTFTTAEASGIVARGKASVSFEADGTAILTSPVRLEWVVKPGKETEGMKFNIMCPHCHIVDPAKFFQVVRASMMSNGESTTTVVVAGFVIPVVDEEEAQAAQELNALLPSIHDNAQDHIAAFEMISSHHASNSSRSSKSKRPAAE